MIFTKYMVPIEPPKLKRFLDYNSLLWRPWQNTTKLSIETCPTSASFGYLPKICWILVDHVYGFVFVFYWVIVAVEAIHQHSVSQKVEKIMEVWANNFLIQHTWWPYPINRLPFWHLVFLIAHLPYSSYLISLHLNLLTSSSVPWLRVRSILEFNDCGPTGLTTEWTGDFSKDHEA